MRYFLVLVFGVFYACSASALERFIERDGATLKDGDKVFRFAGIQAPELHRIEDDARGVCAADKRGWGQYFKWPTADEQENWFQALAQTGHKAMRVYVLSVAQQDDAACGRETHILPPLEKDGAPRLNEAAMLHYDRMIALADKYNVRLILPFIDHWPWWGGRQQLAAFYGETEEDFYNVNSKTFASYKSIIQQVILRKNTVTGRLYRDEKAIMAWESGNELLGTTPAFLQHTAAHIKHLDKNHLFMDGTYTKVNEFALQDANVDIISNHYYQNVGNLSPDTVAADLKTIAGKKVYVVGEFGLLNIERLQAIMDAAINTEYKGAKTAGAFIWGLRGHRHDGGFYWHLEPANNKTYSYHIPGFAEGDVNEEIKVVDMVRKAIANMNGETQMAPLPKPYAPIMRKISAPQKINWLGAAVGRSYRIERANTPAGPWKIIGDNISDGKNKFAPAVDDLFADKDTLEKGKTYFYRVIAKNESGESAPSNVESLAY
jgi:mannan endo-1,4-beta-mannosidase